MNEIALGIVIYIIMIVVMIYYLKVMIETDRKIKELAMYDSVSRSGCDPDNGG